MQLETPRLLLREITPADYDAWFAILSDPRVTQHYAQPIDQARMQRWMRWTLDNYACHGFGLWAVILKETGEFIGDCGITMQPIHGQQLPEIGYHIHPDHQRRGYASEAAARCMQAAFVELDFPAVYSYMKYTNAPSWGVAVKNGMRLVDEYDDPEDIRLKVYAITREEWLARQEN